MHITRRGFVVGSLTALLTTPLNTTVNSKALFEGIAQGEAPGDLGYCHALYHELYVEVFGKLGKCACGVGECRVTDWRETMLESPVGYDVIVGRQWQPLGKLPTVWIPKPEQVPVELRRERAHVCAYYNGGQLYIPCAIINVAQT